MIDLEKLQPTVITRDLRNKFILIAADYKFGKTTFMSQIPGCLILSFEPGVNAIAGVYSQTITKWSDFKQVLRQLENPSIKEKFNTIAIDTYTVAADMCQEYVVQRANEKPEYGDKRIETLGDVPFGKLYDEYYKELSRSIRKIANLGYGMVFATHVDNRTEVINGEEVNRVVPKLDKRAFDIVNSLVDIIGIGVYDWNNCDEFGRPGRLLVTGQTKKAEAGGRFTHLPPVLPFTYSNVVNALHDAIEKAGQVDNATIVDKNDYSGKVDTEKTFAEIRSEASELWTKLLEKDRDNYEVVMTKVESIFGVKKKLSEIVETEKDLFEVLVVEMRQMLNN